MESIQAAIAVGFSSESKELSNSTLPGANDDEFEDEGPDIEWNMYTAAGWFAVLLGIANIFLFLPCIFKEYPIAAKEAQLQRRAANVTDTRLPKPDYPVLVCVLISFFVILFIYVLLETLLVPMCIDLYAWTDEKAIMVAGIGLSIAGVISTIMFAMVGLLTRKCDERKVYMFLGLLPLLLSMICFFPMGSTYPKMQNCTSDVYPEHTNSTDIQTTTALSILSTNSSPFSSKDSDMVAPHNVTEGLITDVTAYPVTENPHIYENLLLGDGNLSDHNSVSRRRRHIARNEKCKDLGCPPEQEWCLYTPIIEQIQLGIAGFIAVVGYPVAFALSSSLFSKILGPKPQGVWMGVLTSTGSFSRVSGPIFVSYMYTSLGTRWTFGFLFFTLAFTVILMSVVYKRLVPMKITRA
ncbi:Major facilitator superfamily domain-containing protein 8 [Halocaridina rubra]|uniref:Major facilitator superfamily domain-containing protein 8 n=1 Tax=Halocaridina rubra TaxID=373956 RepID=A0AAN8XRP1_HALRR